MLEQLKNQICEKFELFKEIQNVKFFYHHKIFNTDNVLSTKTRYLLGNTLNMKYKVQVN